MERWREKLKVFMNHRWLAFVCAMWVQSCAGIGYLFGSVSPVIKSRMGYNQREVAVLSVAKDLGDAIGFVAGSLCEILPIWAILLIGVVQNLVGYGLVWLIVTQKLPPLPLWVVVSAKVIRNEQTGHPEVYGFIEFASRAAPERVLNTYNGTPMLQK